MTIGINVLFEKISVLPIKKLLKICFKLFAIDQLRMYTVDLGYTTINKSGH